MPSCNDIVVLEENQTFFDDKFLTKKKNQQKFNYEKCDVFSLAMCALEMASYELFNNVKYKGVINKNEILLK